MLFEATFAVFQKMRVPVSLKKIAGNNNEKMRERIHGEKRSVVEKKKKKKRNELMTFNYVAVRSTTCTFRRLSNIKVWDSS